uniref:ER lumen protein retaining receptor n=1 Tax=Rhizophora mucronata TaxID=61149 RepID=A0A2P2KX34_RHIMU
MRAQTRPIYAVRTWVRRQPPKVKAFLAVVAAMATLVLLRFIVHDHDNLFVAAEAVHSIGISVLIYKLMKEKTCAGLSLKSQDLTAFFLAVRLYCSFVMEFDIHTLLDLATLATTLWVIYMIRFKLKSSYMEDKDNFAIYYVVSVNESNITFSSCITGYLYVADAFPTICCHKSLWYRLMHGVRFCGYLSLIRSGLLLDGDMWFNYAKMGI